MAKLPDDLPTLEKNFEVARARFNYSVERKLYWANEEHRRMLALNEASLAYLKNKHGLTDEELMGPQD